MANLICRIAVSLPMLMALCLIASVAAAQSPVPQIPTEGSVTGEQIESAIAAVETREGLDDETRGRIIDQLRDAGAQLQNRASAEAAAAAFTAALPTAPEATARLRATLDASDPEDLTLDDLGVGEDTPLVELEQALARYLAAVTSAEVELRDIELQVSTQTDRPGAVRERIDEIRASIGELIQVIESDPLPDENPILADARRLNAELKRYALNAELARLDQELVSNGVRLELLRVQREAAERDVASRNQRAELLRGIVNRSRQAAAEQARLDAAEAQLATSDKHPVLRVIAEGNLALTHELPGIAADIERATKDLADIESQVRQIEQKLGRAKQRLDVGGVSQGIGGLLVDERRNLPGVTQYRSEVRARGKTLRSVGLEQVRIEEQRWELSPIDAAVEAAMNQIAEDITDPAELASIREEVAGLLMDRRDLLAQAAETYRSYILALGDLDLAQRRLIESANEYRQFLDENLIWIPSSAPLGLDTIRDFGDATAWALSPESWLVTLAGMRAALGEYPLESAVALLGLALLSLIRRPLSVRVSSINDKVGKLSTDSIGLTFTALGICVLRAAPLPAGLAVASVAIQRSPDPTEFSVAVGLAFGVLAPFTFNLLLFRMLFARDGVMRTHFDWHTENLDIIRRQLDRLFVIGVPVVFVTVLAYAAPVLAYRDSLGRLGFIALMILFSIVFRTLGNPKGQVASTYYARRPDSWISRLKWAWYAIEVGGPLVLALLAAIGYLYTAAILTGRFIDTIWLLLAIVVANLVFLRWLALTRRRIALQIALEKREARQAEKNTAEDAEEEFEASEGGPPVAESKPLDLDAVDQQTRKLLHAGLFFVGIIAVWGIWSDVLPALSILDQVELWSRTTMVEGIETISPVTLADLLLALVIAGVTWVASKNLPGLMEIAVLQRLDLQPGGRYTINTLLRYLVVTVGVISILSIIGWNWSRIQWLVAALSVGLGFGLQEIVANFVAGLIILFERPVRVGDTVTVGQLTGTVSKVQIRATTITDWDRKEIIVPNKSFITEQVVNWTLSDPITRVVIGVGISYGSDVKLAHKVIEDTLRAQPLVLDDPPPRAYFMGFGDSSLNFRLYVFSRELGDRFPLMHAVHEDVLLALRENNIEIPFPQRDLHLRTMADDIKGLAGKGTAQDGEPKDD